MSEPKSEAQLQAACHVWFHNTYPHLRGLGFMIHNDGKKTQATANADRARGLVAGAPDWQLAVPIPTRLGASPCPGLFVEFKYGDGSLSPAQRNVHVKLRDQGYQVSIVRTVEAFQRLITEYLA